MRLCLASVVTFATPDYFLPMRCVVHGEKGLVGELEIPSSSFFLFSSSVCNGMFTYAIFS